VITCLGNVRTSIAAACLCGVLVASHSVQGHAAGVAPLQPQSAVLSPKTAGVGLTPTASLPLVPDLVLYESFMEYVGAEDDRIQKQIRQEAARIEIRTNYSDAIGINKDEERVILAILIDAYHRREEIQKQKNLAMREGGIALVRQDQQGVLSAQVREAELIKARGRIYIDMWAELKKQVADGSLRKLDAYINREFTESGPYFNHRQP
jgi:hypothetical protein